MTRYFYFILIIFLLIACSSRKNKPDKMNLIPEKELVSILTDVYITDGILTRPQVHNWFYSLDSITTYYRVIENHGYTKETMDKTMKYYFIKNPKKLIKIYDKVLGILSEMESRIEKEIALSTERKGSLWKGEDFYYFPNPSGSDSTIFDITFRRPGIYTLALNVTLFPDDQSVNPRLRVFSCHPDSIETGKRDYIETLRFIKDGHTHTYNLILNVPKKTTRYFRGCLYDFDNHPDEWDKHLIIDKISITFSSNAL